jgi:hypothetical protein
VGKDIKRGMGRRPPFLSFRGSLKIKDRIILGKLCDRKIRIQQMAF